MIIHDEPTIVGIIRDRQRAMRRAMDRRGILMKVIAADSGIKYDTLLTYFPADAAKTPAQLPTSAQFALCGAIPDDILSLLLPDGRLIVRVPEAIDHDEIAAAMMAYVAAKEAAHHPESEAGREIGPGENVVLLDRFAVVAGKAA